MDFHITFRVRADLQSVNNYYPGGMLMPGRYSMSDYRFGFNGMEKDDDVRGIGNSLDFGARIYDSRLVKWLSMDNVSNPSQSPYCAFENNPIYIIDPDGNSGRAYIDGENIVVEATYYFYGTAIDKVDVKTVAENIQKAWNDAHAIVIVDGKSYNVIFKITAIPLPQRKGETDEQYTKRIADKMASPDYNSESRKHSMSSDIKNNWIRVEDENPSDPLGTKTSQSSGFWLTSDVYDTDASHEFWEGMKMTGNSHLTNCSGDGARISCAENGQLNGATRIVTQQDVDDLELGTLLSGGKKSASVGYFGNQVYDISGQSSISTSNNSNNDDLKIEREK